VEREAFLLSEEQAHQQLEERLSRISGLIQHYRKSL
jgi:hypothetical protein